MPIDRVSWYHLKYALQRERENARRGESISHLLSTGPFHSKPREWATKPHLSAASSILKEKWFSMIYSKRETKTYFFLVDFPAPWPDFLSTRRRMGWGFFARRCCKVAVSLNECMGTTRSSSEELKLSKRHHIYYFKIHLRSAVESKSGGNTLSDGTFCKGDMGYMKSKSFASSGSP